VPALLNYSSDLPGLIRDHLGYREASDALMDPRGSLVRFTPWRRTVMQTLPDGSRLFCKFRHGHKADAVAEWQALHALAELGFRVPKPIFYAQRGSASVVGMAEVPGRPMTALFAEGTGLEPAQQEMPGLLRQLHAAGWVFRDMYWNHVFLEPGEASHADSGAGREQAQTNRLWLIDVERAFRPRFRRRRWIVKDLAGLLSSTPLGYPSTGALRFLRAYLGGLEGDWKALARDVVAKAASIRRHVTRYPG
jgi:hypothetical protein